MLLCQSYLLIHGNIVGDRYVSGNNWAFTREQQQRATEIAPNNYLVTSMGLGDPIDVHPAAKKPLSRRIARKVLKYSYGFDILADQPIFKRATFNGESVTIELENSDGLYACDLNSVNMYLADESRVLKKAKIRIDNDRLILKSAEIKNPCIVRYAFDNCYCGALIFNKSGLPLAPFRTDKDE